MWERARGRIGYGDSWGERYLNKLRVRDPIFSRLSTSKCGDLIVKWIKFNFYQNLKKKNIKPGPNNWENRSFIGDYLFQSVSYC